MPIGVKVTMKNLKLNIISCAFLVISSGNAIANDTVNLHNKNSAIADYEAFKNGGGEDPLERIRNGYRKSYSSDLEGSIREARESFKNKHLGSERERLEEFLLSQDVTKSSDRKAIYDRALDSDGNLDYEAFELSYSNYLNELKSDTGEAIGSRKAFTDELISESSSISDSVGNAHSNNAQTAAKNIISIINSDSRNYAANVKSRLDIAIEDASERVPVGEEAYELAQIFDGECGDACSFPPVIEPEDDAQEDCVYDDDNYILESESDHSEYGVWSKKSESIEYKYNGVVIYEYDRESSDQSGTWVEDEYESGSRAGFSKGSLERVYGGGGTFGSSENGFWQICPD